MKAEFLEGGLMGRLSQNDLGIVAKILIPRFPPRSF